MTEELVTFPTAKLARAKGFNVLCRHGFEWFIYDGKEYGPNSFPDPDEAPIDLQTLPPALQTIVKERNRLISEVPIVNDHLAQWLYARPTQDLLERWMREVHGWIIGLIPVYDKGKCIGYLAADPWNITGDPIAASYSNATIYATFELAREAALQHALNLLP